MAATTHRVTVESIAAGGDGVARLGRLAVFVPRTAPGDVADVAVRVQGRLGRGELLGLVEEGPSRTVPRCRHYVADRCGGCQLQHLNYQAQLEAKRRIVADAIARIARRTQTVPPVVPSPSPWAYRSRLTLTMRRVAGSWRMGLHVLDHPDRVFHLRECPITDPAVVHGWHEIQEASELLPSLPELRGVVRRHGDEVWFVLEGATRWKQAREFARRCPALALVRWHPSGGRPRTVIDRRTRDLPGAAFEQVNPAVAELLRATLVQRVLSAEPATVVDAYAGSGAVARYLAGRGIRVTAIERDAEAAAFAAANMPEGSAVRSAAVEDVLAVSLPADVVIVNPPRIGLHRRVTKLLAEAKGEVQRILYVSCDPATLARDLGRLPRWRVSFIRPYDMFPQTAHVETLCELVPEDA